MANKYLNDTGLKYFYDKLKTMFLSEVAYDSTNKKITKTKNGTTSDVVTLATMKSAMALNNVDNTADANKSVASAGKLTTPIDVEGIKFDGSAAVSHYATCSTGATTAKKVATITPTTTNFELVVGTRIFVKFTAIINVASATLNVNGTGDIPIFYNGAALAKGLTDANGTYEFVYNGTQWELIGDLDTNTTYSTLTQAIVDTGTETTGKLVTAKILKDTITNAIAGVTQISYQVVTSLPTTGETGVIYLIAHSHGTGDGYDEYIWLGSSYEKIGNTDVDLSDYMKTSDMVAITTTEIDTLFA